MLKVTLDVPAEPFAFGPLVAVLLVALAAGVVLVIHRRPRHPRR